MARCQAGLESGCQCTDRCLNLWTCTCKHPVTGHSMMLGRRTHCLFTGCLCDQYTEAGVKGEELQMETTKPTNPKDAVGSDKLPMHLFPQAAVAFGVIGLENGMLKYGRTNWREAGIRPSIYVDAIVRHLTDWFEGEDFDPDDGVHNLAGAQASLAILIDALCSGTLNDDRNFNPGKSWRNARASMEPHVKRLKELHAGRDPKHWTIQDNEEKV